MSNSVDERALKIPPYILYITIYRVVGPSCQQLSSKLIMLFIIVKIIYFAIIIIHVCK